MHASEIEELERTWQVCRRPDFAPDQADVAGSLLEPAASLLNADTAVFRRFSLTPGAVCLTATVGLGVRDSVHDAYRARYLALDPARYLLRRRFTEPLFSAEEFSASSQACAAAIGTASAYGRLGPMTGQLRESFVRYRREFLLPNGFYHHLGFCFQDVGAKHAFFFDFHRARTSLQFTDREVIRAKIVAMVLHARSSGANHWHGDGPAGTELPPGDRERFCIKGQLEEVEPSQRLSAREVEVAEAVAQGLSNKEVGAALDISVRTVENHLRSIFSKLGISTRTRLVARMHEQRGQAQGVAS